MAEIHRFEELYEEPELDGMDAEQLRAYLASVRARIQQLDEEEPEDMESEAHEDWGGRHEALEDLADEILDRLEEI